MCGIFGFTISDDSGFSTGLFQSVIKTLFKLSESRGKDASGLAMAIGTELRVLKSDVPATALMQTKAYRKMVKGFSSYGRFTRENRIGEPITIIGHSRMATNGSQRLHTNNQPVIKSELATVHNGIVVNVDELFDRYPEIRRELEVDTEIIPSLVSMHSKATGSVVTAAKKTFEAIEGAASVAMLFGNYDLMLLATNHGSLFTALSQDKKTLVFASEKYMLRALARRISKLKSYNIKQITPGNACLIDTRSAEIYSFSLNESESFSGFKINQNKKKIVDVSDRGVQDTQVLDRTTRNQASLEKLIEDNSVAINSLKRCTKCILPETFPFISFDDQGVCSVCRAHKKIDYKGVEALKKILSPYRKNHFEPDVIVPLSGGRDSSFALHYIKKELGMNPVAYTYDWGMVTDLARRNISRVTGKLGIEHILISADINKKRKFIRKNVNAWLKRPSLGTIPLFMAGDKQFFYYSNLLQKQMDVGIVLFGMNLLERTDFKVAFCGVKEKKKEDRHYHLSGINKLSIALYYGKEYILNPSYLNSSLVDTLSAYMSYYLIPHRYHIFYEYFEWNEDLITRTIIDEYDWETAGDTATTWRIGDGTASFYNYIYYNVAGFSENDTFRSNQVRQGLISREEALEQAKIENRPRFESIKWYCDTNDIGFEKAFKIINTIPKLYAFG
jgi:glucosamine--fructose-6-phosphate aminotransferase (isomerizing)